MAGMVKVDGEEFKYNDDKSWEKWKNIITYGSKNWIEIINWYVKEVLIDPPLHDFNLVIKVCEAVRKDLGIDEDSMKLRLKNIGKSCRGIAVKDCTAGIMEFNIMSNLPNISYAELKKLTFDEILFFNKCITEKMKMSNK